MVDSSKVRQLCPSVSFFFACLGASLGSFSTYCLPNEGFVPSGSSLGFVVADLHLLLHQSLNWFKEMVDEREVVSEVRSSELETGCHLVMTLSRRREILLHLAFRHLDGKRLDPFMPLGRSVL